MADALVPVLPPAVPTTYRERLAQFRILEEKRLELIEVRAMLRPFTRWGDADLAAFCRSCWTSWRRRKRS